MTQDIHRILKEYWGYTSFRSLQEDIILSVMEGKDTLALLPTGGGKSLCFQMPVMVRPGIGIVISPLIALMDDQVRNLNKLGIPAKALTSSLTYREIDLALENAANGSYKFLYLSPERLQTEIVQERLRRMKVNLLAVDEAHCISQWGYDFRPPYLKIAEIRELLPGIPVLALTATATPKVVEDIQKKLRFPEKNVFQKSFYRPDLHYNVLQTEQKWKKTLDILRRIRGSGIIYSRNRRHTVEIAGWLQQNGLSADFYHAGLSSGERKQKQKAWMENRTRIMVCTNAFGMGIDKPDVRIVLHLELPDSLEAYFQEAGRAGRDGYTSYSVIVTGPSDVQDLKSRYLDTFPDLDFIKRTYQALGNYLQLAVGSGENQSFAFTFSEFVQQYNLAALKAYQTLKILEKEGLISLNEGFKQPSRLLLKANRTTLYDFQLRNPKMDPLIKILVRSYGGLQTEYTAISETLLAKRLNTSLTNVVNGLWMLKKQGIVDYLPQEEESAITFIQPRQSTDYLSISNENLRDRLLDLKARIQSVVDFVQDNNTCRSRILLRYFGEEHNKDCGHCDVCRRKNATGLTAEQFLKYKRDIETILNGNTLTFEELREKLSIGEEHFSRIIRWLLDEGTITEEAGKFRTATY